MVSASRTASCRALRPVTDGTSDPDAPELDVAASTGVAVNPPASNAVDTTSDVEASRPRRPMSSVDRRDTPRPPDRAANRANLRQVRPAIRGRYPRMATKEAAIVASSETIDP
jgi:hypothetical protein